MTGSTSKGRRREWAQMAKGGVSEEEWASERALLGHMRVSLVAGRTRQTIDFLCLPDLVSRKNKNGIWMNIVDER